MKTHDALAVLSVKREKVNMVNCLPPRDCVNAVATQGLRAWSCHPGTAACSCHTRTACRQLICYPRTAYRQLSPRNCVHAVVTQELRAGSCHPELRACSFHHTRSTESQAHLHGQQNDYAIKIASDIRMYTGYHRNHWKPITFQNDIQSKYFPVFIIFVGNKCCILIVYILLVLCTMKSVHALLLTVYKLR